jgi:hypothetical protein
MRTFAVALLVVVALVVAMVVLGGGEPTPVKDLKLLANAHPPVLMGGCLTVIVAACSVGSQPWCRP